MWRATCTVPGEGGTLDCTADNPNGPWLCSLRQRTQYTYYGPTTSCVVGRAGISRGYAYRATYSFSSSGCASRTNRLLNSIAVRAQILVWNGSTWGVCAGLDTNWSYNNGPTWGWGGSWNFSSASSPPCGTDYYESWVGSFVTTNLGASWQGGWFDSGSIYWPLATFAASQSTQVSPPPALPDPGTKIPVINQAGAIDKAAGLVEVGPRPPGRPTSSVASPEPRRTTSDTVAPKS
jgi:hypothetical protein